MAAASSRSAIGADGIELIEVSLEFGADLSIDLGVASGGVSIMAGIYFSLQTVPNKQVQLTGFLRADGNLSVLGIISISMEFYLGLTYLDPGKAYGTASVSVSVSVLFVSVSVSVTMQKTIGGSGDPEFPTSPDGEELDDLLRGLRMTKQRVLWTACPHGKATDGKLRVSVHVGAPAVPDRQRGVVAGGVPRLASTGRRQTSGSRSRSGPDTYDADIVSAAAVVVALGGPLPLVDPGRPLRVLEPDRPPRSTATRPGSCATSSRAPMRRSRTPRPSGIGRASSCSRVRTASASCRSTAGSSTTGSRP